MDARKSHHAWLIDLVPEKTGYSFKCWLPERNSLVSTCRVYPSFDEALMAAKKRADLEVASWALTHFLNCLCKDGKIGPCERMALISSILAVGSSL